MGRCLSFVQGYVKIRLESSMPERFLSLCVHNQIPLWNLKNNDLYYEMELHAKDFFRLDSFRRKTGSRIVLLEKHGLPFFFHKNRKRKAFFLGSILSALLLYFCSLFIWDIQIEGNHYNSSETILDTLAEFQITDGVLKKELDCQQIASQIRASFPNVVWVSAKIRGTCLIVELKENEDAFQTVPAEEEKSCDIAAAKDGQIVKIVTRAGIPQVKEGESCKAGDILVTGRLEILNNDSQIQRYEYVKADADIEILTEYSYYDEFSLEHSVKIYQEEQRYRMVQFWGHEFSFFSPEKQDADLYRTETPVYLTPSFCLPISYGTIRVRPYKTLQKTYTEKEAKALAQEHLRVFMGDLVKNGADVQKQNIMITVGPQKCVAKGHISVIEPTGKSVPVEQIALPEEKSIQ